MDVKILKYKENKDGSATLDLEFDFKKGERKRLAQSIGRKRLTKKALEGMVQYALLDYTCKELKKIRRRAK